MTSTPSRKKFEPFTYKTLDAFQKKINSLALEIPLNPEVEILQQRVKLGERFVPNRLGIQPMEGFDADVNGSPTDLTFRRYKRYANSGVGLIWFEATAISENCRSNEHQLILSEETLGKFKDLVSITRDINRNCLLILQLNHSGRYSIKDKTKFPIRAFSHLELDNAKGISEKDGIIVSDDLLRGIEDLWVQKVGLAKEAGFDGVDIKSCHGYLINELLGARTREDSDYGGKSLENRARLLLNIIKKSKKEFKNAKDYYLSTRMSVYNGIPYPHGFGVKEEENEKFPATLDIAEPLEIIKELYDLGVRLINLSVGNPHHKGHLTRPYDTPIEGGDLPEEHPLYSVNRLINIVASLKRELPEDMVVVGSGYSYLRQYAGYMAAGLIHENKVDICGFGRMAFANPEFPKQILEEGEIDKKKVCITCSKCSTLMRKGKNTGCVIRDPQYKE